MAFQENAELKLAFQNEAMLDAENVLMSGAGSKKIAEWRAAEKGEEVRAYALTWERRQGKLSAVLYFRLLKPEEAFKTDGAEEVYAAEFMSFRLPEAQGAMFKHRASQ